MEKEWLMLLQSHSEPITREVTDHSERKGHIAIQAPYRWDRLVADFHDIFDPLGMPVERDTVHQTELLPNAEPHYRC